MRYALIILVLVSFCFAGFVYDGKMLKELTDEGFVIYDVLNADSSVQYSDAFATPEQLGIDSTVIAVLVGELPDSVLVEIQPELENNVNVLGWIAGGLATLLGIGWATKRVF